MSKGGIYDKNSKATNCTPPPKIYTQNPGNNYNLSTNNKDTISFTGLRVSQAKTTQEIRTLGNLFFDALK